MFVPPPPAVDLSVSAALRHLKLTPGSTVSISDSAVNIQKNLATLQSLNARITAVQASSDASKVLTVSYKDYAADKGILAKWSNNASHQFNLTDVTAQAAGTLWNSDFTKSMTIKDTAINLQNNFDSLVNIQTQDNLKITALTQTNTSALITLDTTKYTSGRDSGLLSKLNKGIQNLAITNATVNDVVGDIGSSLRLGFTSSIKSISIIDNTDNIDNGLNALQRVGMKIKTISQNNLAIDNTLELDASQIRNNASVLGKIITGYQLAAQNTAASQLSSMLANRKVISIDVKDTASNISRNWDKINSINTSLNFVEVSNSEIPIKIKASQLAVSQDLIAKFKVPDEYVPPNPNNGVPVLPSGDFKLEISEATASQVDELQASEQITAFDIKDTAENIGLYLTDLKNSIDSTDGKLQFIKTANTAQIEMSFSSYSDPDIEVLLSKVNKGLYNIKLTDVTVANLESITEPTLTSNLLFNDKAIESIEIVDSVMAVQENLDLLNAAGSRIKSIELGYNGEVNDPVIAPLTVDAKDFINRQRVLEKINGGYKVDIENASVKQALSLASNPHVHSIDIEDSSSNISSYWNQLLDINEQLDDIGISGARVSITADQYELGLEADIQDKILQSDIPVTFAIKNAKIDQALTLVTEDQASKYISTLEIKDSGVNIVGSLTDLRDLLDDDTITTSLFQVDPKNALEITYADFVEFDSVFDAITGQSYKLSVSGATVTDALNMAAANPVNLPDQNLNFRNVSSINIEGSTTEVSENLNSLLTMGKKLASIDLTNKTDNISITHEQYLKGKSVLDRINDDYSLDIKDAAVYNAASIVNNSKVKALSVFGSASYISNAWDTLVGLGSKLKTVLNTTNYVDTSAITKASTSIGLSISQWLNSSTLIDKISDQGSNKFAIYDASVEDAKNIVADAAQNDLVTDIKITDTSAIIDHSFDAENSASLTLLSNSKVTAINLADPAVPMDLNFSQIDLVSAATNISVLDKIKTNFSLNVDNATVTQAFTLQASSGADGTHKYSNKVKTIDVSDSSTNVQTSFDNLKGLTKLEAIGLNDADQVMTFSASKILETSSVSLFKKITQSPYFLDATSASMSQLTQLYPFDNTVTDTVEPMIDSAILPNLRNFYVLDSAANVSSSYNELIALGPNLKGLGLSSGSDLDINYAQWQASKATLAALTSGAEAGLAKATYAFNLSDVSAQDAVGSTAGNLTTNPVNSLYTTNTSAVFSDALVKSVTVKDTADQIAANWDALQIEFTTTDRVGYSATKLSDLVFTDNDALTLSAAQVVKTHLTDSTGPVYQELLDKVGPTNGVVVRDTAANIKAYWDDLAALYANGAGSLGPLISKIELTSDNPKVELTLAQQDSLDGGALIEILEGKENSVETIS